MTGDDWDGGGELRSRKSIDLNCDVGESTGCDLIGNDRALIPLVSSANIACGGHGGDEQHTASAVRLALENHVQIGAHPSFPDRTNFGRREITMSPSALRDSLLHQLEYLNKIVTDHSGTISYVKPHGALYHCCVTNPVVAVQFLDAVIEFDSGLALLCQPEALLASLCHQRNMRFVREAFADRKYQANGQLVPRTAAGAVLKSKLDVARQATDIAAKQYLTIDSNHQLEINVDSICIHGDHLHAVDNLKQIRSAFHKHEITVYPFQSA